jgi:hypothetical protein
VLLPGTLIHVTPNREQTAASNAQDAQMAQVGKVVE